MHKKSKKQTEVQRAWRFDTKGLQPGDVVLESGHGLASQMIKFADGGPFSHALLWLGGTDFAESVDGGVRPISVLRVIVTDPSDWTVLRYTDPAAAETAVQHARNLVHMRYDLVGAINTKLRLRAEPDPTALFCSQFVATAYHRAGITLVDGMEPALVTPNVLCQRSKLEPVEPVPLKELDLNDPEVKAEIAYYQDRNAAYAGTQMDQEREASQRAFQSVQPMFVGVTVPPEYPVNCPPGNLSDVIDLLRIIDLTKARTISDHLTEALEKEGYFNFLDDQLPQIGMRVIQDRIQVMSGMIPAPEVRKRLDFLEQGEAGRAGVVSRYKNNADQCEATLQSRDLSIFRQLLEMYRKNEIQMTVLFEQEQQLMAECRKCLGLPVEKAEAV